MSKYILVDEYTHEALKGKPAYFKQITAIGPQSTQDIAEAQRFDTRDDAVTSPANRHWSANWHIEEVES